MALEVNNRMVWVTMTKVVPWVVLMLAGAATCCLSVSRQMTHTTLPIEPHKLNNRPIIGILSQDLSSEERKFKPQYNSYIAASYVKYYESSGARVVPILINQPDEYYEKIVNSVNGIVFPGGGVSITNSSGFGKAGRKLYDLVLDAADKGRPMPLWATCLGFEMLMLLAGNTNEKMEVQTSCKDSNVAHLPNLTPAWKTSRLLGEALDDIMNPLTTMKVTSEFHTFCVTNETFMKLDIYKDFNILSTNIDLLGEEYISTVEHKRYPIWGTQWHPEKNQFEWKFSSIPHFPEAIRVAQYFSNFFVDQARLNYNSFVNETEEQAHLIYNYMVTNTAQFNDSVFQQCYFFY